jgi:hypothetical protein
MGAQSSTTTGRKSGLPGLLIIMVGLLFVAVYFPYEAPIGDKAAKVAYVQDPELQSKRRASIQEAVAQGIFYKVDATGPLPHLWVAPTFKALDFDAKSNLVNVVYDYHLAENPDHDPIILYDSMTGKSIGKYSATFGLDLD